MWGYLGTKQIKAVQCSSAQFLENAEILAKLEIMGSYCKQREAGQASHA